MGAELPLDLASAFILNSYTLHILLHWYKFTNLSPSLKALLV